MNTKNCSLNALKAMENGEKPLEDWTREELLSLIRQFSGWKDDEAAEKIAPYEQLDDEILIKYFLVCTSWHHVNRKPVWFYSFDLQTLKSMNEHWLYQLQKESYHLKQQRQKPMMALVSTVRWETCPNGKTRSRFDKSVAVVYQGNAYFQDGKCRPIEREVVEVNQKIGRIIKEKRKLFEKIIRVMRKEYQLAI